MRISPTAASRIMCSKVEQDVAIDLGCLKLHIQSCVFKQIKNSEMGSLCMRVSIFGWIENNNNFRTAWYASREDIPGCCWEVGMGRVAIRWPREVACSGLKLTSIRVSSPALKTQTAKQTSLSATSSYQSYVSSFIVYEKGMLTGSSLPAIIISSWDSIIQTNITHPLGVLIHCSAIGLKLRMVGSIDSK
jgi:hypothetical protein